MIVKHDPLRSRFGFSSFASSLSRELIPDRCGSDLLFFVLGGMGALQSVPGQPEYIDLAEKTGCEY